MPEAGDGDGLVPREGVADGGEHGPHHALGGGPGRGCLVGDVGDEFVLVHLRFRLNCARIARNGADRSSVPALGTPRNRSCEQSRSAQAWWNRSRASLAWSVPAATSSATERAVGVDAYIYLVDVLQRISMHPANRAIELTPRMWKSLFADDPLRSDLGPHNHDPPH